LEVLKLNEGVEVQQRLVDLPSFNPVQLPPESQLITDDPDNLPDKLNSVKDYMSDRQLWVDQGYEYYWSNSLGYRDRFIIPFYYEGQIVGWTARTVTADKKPKYITESQPGFVFNLDEQRPQKVFCIVVEGPIDAIHIDGVALMRAEVNDQQAMLIDRLNRDVIVLPDRDNTGAGLIEQAITRGWSVSMPEWAPDIKDVNDAVLKYGRLYTLYSIVSAAESSPLKIRLRAKKWYGK
jgi:DNA primase